MKRNSLFTKIAALMLCVMMVIGCLPVSAFAANYVEGEMDVWEGEPVALKVNGDLDSEGNTLYDGDNTLTLYAGKAITTYNWTAKEEGYLSITMPNYAGWEYTLTNTTTNEKASSSTETDATATAKVDVNKDDTVTLVVTTINLGSNVSVERTIYAEFNYPLGSQNNPIKFTAYPNVEPEGSYVTYVDGDGTYADGSATPLRGQYVMTVKGTGDFTVMSGMASAVAVDGIAKIMVEGGFYNVVTFTITGATAIEEILFTKAEGIYGAFATLKVGTVVAPAENVASVLNAQGYVYSWTAEKDGKLILNFGENATGFSIINYEEKSEIEVNAGDELIVEIQHNDAYGDVSFTAAFEPVAVAKIGETGYATVEEALNAATSGQTVTMVANSGSKDAPEGILIIKPDVTLNVATYSLYADVVIGLDGSSIYGSAINKDTGIGLGQLYVDQGSIALDSSGYNPTGNQYYLPVWTGTRYEFTLVVMNYDTASCWTKNNETYLQFGTSWSTGFRTLHLAKNGSKQYGVSIVCAIGWTTKDTIENLEVTYKDQFVMTASGGSSGFYGYTLGEIDTKDELTLTPKVISETGVVVYLEPTEIS